MCCDLNCFIWKVVLWVAWHGFAFTCEITSDLPFVFFQQTVAVVFGMPLEQDQTRRTGTHSQVYAGICAVDEHGQPVERIQA